MVSILVKNDADVNTKDDLGFTPLFYATGRYPDAEIAAYLLDEGGASVHTISNTGACALHGCALQGNMGKPINQYLKLGVS